MGLKCAPLIAVVVVILAGCAAAPPIAPRAASAGATNPAAAVAPETELAALVEEYFESIIALYPTFATQLGDERYNDKLERSATRAFAERVVANERDYLGARSASIRRGCRPQRA